MTKTPQEVIDFARTKEWSAWSRKNWEPSFGDMYYLTSAGERCVMVSNNEPKTYGRAWLPTSDDLLAWFKGRKLFVCTSDGWGTWTAYTTEHPCEFRFRSARGGTQLEALMRLAVAVDEAARRVSLPGKV